MPHLSIALAAAGAAAVLLPASAGAATLTTNAPCYLEQEPMAIAGTGWPAGGSWSVTADQLYDFGTADAAGSFVSTAERAPIIAKPTTKPKTFRLTGRSGDTVLATTTFRVVNFLVTLRDGGGAPTGTTRWGFSGFRPGKAVYVHVRRGGRTWTVRAGKASRPCGTLSARLRRLPAVPAGLIRSGTYKIFVDSRRRLALRAPQYRLRFSVFR